MKFWELVAFFQYGDLPTSYFVKRGMKVGKNFNRQSSTRLDPSHCWLISIGDDVTIGNKVQILAHDDTTRTYTGYGRIAPVKIGDRVFIGEHSTSLMNTTIGNDVIIGAGSLVTGNIPDDSIVAGVPARVIGKTSEYIAREKEKMQNSLVFDNTYTYQKNITKAKKDEMLSRFEDKPGVGYLDIGFYED